MSNKNISHIIADTIVEFDKDFAYEDAFELAIQIGNKIKIDVDKDADTLCPVEPEVVQNADISLDLCLPERIGWAEFTEDNIIFHYSTKDEYENCTNAKRAGIKLSVSV